MQHAASRLAAFALLAAAAWAQPAKTAGHWQGKTKIGELRAVSGIYRGTLGASGEIAGEWSEGGNRTQLTFARAAK